MDTTDNQIHQQQQSDQLMELVRHETEETRKWDIALGCGMASILLVDHEIFTLNALIVFLLIQVMRYKIQVCDNVFMVTYRIKSNEDRMEYLQAAQHNRVALKLSTYIMLIGLYGCIYTFTANLDAWLLVKWCVALATIFV